MRRMRAACGLALVLGLCGAQAARAGITNYAYDAAGRLVSTDQSNGAGVYYQYDPAGNRVQKSSCGNQVVLASGQTLYSPSSTYHLTMQATDGNLVVYSSSGTANWASNTGGHPGAYAMMRPNGTLGVYSPQGMLMWVTDNFEGPCATLDMQDDGNLVIYDTTGTGRWGSLNASLSSTGDRMLSNPTSLVTGEQLVSADGRFSLQLQNSGALVILGPPAVGSTAPTVLWTAPAAPAGSPAANRVTMQADGNFVTYSPTAAVWASGTGGNAGDYIVMQTDGNLVIYASAAAGGAALWSSGTGGH